MTTKQASATEQLGKLNGQLTKARQTVLEIKAERSGFETETDRLKLELNALRDTDPDRAEKLNEELNGRFPNGPFDLVWPEQDKLDQAIQKMHTAEAAANAFRIRNFEALIEEAAKPAQDALDRIEEAFRTIQDAALDYRAAQDAVREVILETPSLDGQDTAYDVKVKEWADVASLALANETITPRLADAAGWKLDQLRANLEAEDA